MVGAIQGPAIGGGLGLALVADFRVASPEARFAANFVKIGFHPGFGLTYTLPRLVGVQRANLLFLTGRRIGGEEAFRWGLADVLAEPARLREEATKLAAEIAENAPLAVNSTRATVRRGLAEAVQAQTDIEFVEQDWLMRTEDHREGIKAVAERRPGRFVGR
jgi:enoyl-CoA hydratase/carnithine racemase